MTFKDVAIKNFKANIKKYFSYFLCSSFSIMIFFIYASLLFNDSLSKKSGYDMMAILFKIALVALFTFSVFFINYAHSAFIKTRNKEFGLYLSLGMSSRDLSSMINIENGIIMITSLITGLLTGILFSRLFQMVVLKLLDMDGVKYTLNYKSFFLTVSVFLFIFLIVYFSSLKNTKKLDIADLFKSSRKGTCPKKHGTFLGIIGIGIMLLSVIYLIEITKHEKLNNNGIVDVSYLLLTFTSLYMIISNIGPVIMKLIKNSSYYYKNILYVKEINHKFNQTKKIIFILSLLSAMTVALVASPFSLYSLSGKIAEENRPNHIEFVQLGNINKLSENEYDSILSSSDTKLLNKKTTEFISLYFSGAASDKYDLIKQKPIISQETYNSITGSDISLKKGELLNVITAWEPGYHGFVPGNTVTLSDGIKAFKFTIKDSAHLKWIASAISVDGGSYPASSGIVISNEDYSYIKNNILAKSIGTYYEANFKDWKKTSTVVDKINLKLRETNYKLSGTENKISTLFILVSTLKTYESLKRGYSFFVFVMVIMGFLFFISSGSVLFFKHFTEINNDKERFYKLYKLGISEKEAQVAIAKELRVTFFTPLIFGSALGYCYIYLLGNMFGGKDIMDKFMVYVTYVVIVYFLFQAVFYFITKRKYTKEVLGGI